jgi:hypothetical protein
VLIIDVGHAQYSSRYDFNTLRCVARDVAARVGHPAAVVLSSWMWSTRGIGTGWCHPATRCRVVRTSRGGRDHVDLIDIDLAVARRLGAEAEENGGYPRFPGTSERSTTRSGHVLGTLADRASP